MVQADAVPEPLAKSPPGLLNLKSAMRAAISAFCSFVQILRLVKSCALSAASACVKWTT